MADAVRHLLLIFGGFCLAVLAAAGYWQVVRGPALRGDPRNPRLRLSAGFSRGGIVSADGEVLVASVPAGSGRYRREYRGPAGLAPTIGYVSSRYGASGLEAAYDSYLRGEAAESWVERLRGFPRTLGGRRLPDLQLTIRAEVQRRAERAMGGRRGAVVALDPRTGDVLALVSLPGFRPDRVDADWDALRRDPASPLLNRAVAGLYPPGSAYKPAVALSCLEAGELNRKETFDCRGRRTVRGQTIEDLGGAVHGRIDLAAATQVSCNYVFSGLAMRLTPARLAEDARRYGLLAPAGLRLAEEEGRFPEPTRLQREDLAQLGIGQGSLLVTPFGLARFAALLANRGRPVEPRLVQGPGTWAARRQGLFRWGRPLGERGAEAWAVDAVNQLLAGVVSAGTGWRAQLPGVKVAGKTGSAENPHGSPHAWFMGFAPADEPRVAVAVVVENAGLGGQVAAPVAREVLAAALGR